MRLRIAAEHGVSALKESLLKRLRATELADLWEVCCTCAAASSDDAVSRAQEPGADAASGGAIHGRHPGWRCRQVVSGCRSPT
jgi:hypothetical protein